VVVASTTSALAFGQTGAGRADAWAGTFAAASGWVLTALTGTVGTGFAVGGVYGPGF
jgi:hypothetical protein